MTTASFTVTGMTCAHCERAVTAELSKVPGVTGVQVSAGEGTLVVESPSPLDTSAIIDAVTEAGYEAKRA